MNAINLRASNVREMVHYQRIATAMEQARPLYQIFRRVHFAARVERSSLHRRVKGGELGYEDEKFSYLAVSRTLVPATASPRIIAQPRVGKAEAALRLCEATGLAERRIPRQDKLKYKSAKKLRWGDIVRNTHE